MSTNTALDDIKARVEGHTEGPWELAGGGEWLSPWGIDIGSEDSSSCPTVRPSDAELIAAAPKLLAALEAVEALLEGKYQLYAAVCGETCCKDILGVDHEAIADNVAANIRQAITDALA